MWTLGFGSLNREAQILMSAKTDKMTAVIHAAIHCEWTLKRVILKMGKMPTRLLKDRLEEVSSFKNDNSKRSYFHIWKQEISAHYKNAALGTVLGSFQSFDAKALKVRGKLVHGNNGVKDETAMEAIKAFFEASKKLRDFAEKHGFDVDERLSSRQVPKAIQ